MFGVSLFQHFLAISRGRIFLWSTIWLDEGNSYGGNNDVVALGVAVIINDLSLLLKERNYSV